MSEVPCPAEVVTLRNEQGREVPGLVVVCPICLTEGQAFGTGSKSVKRACWDLSRRCPYRNRRNFYVAVFDAEHGETTAHQDEKEEESLADRARRALCVTPDAPPEVVEAAYRALAKLHHPDKGGDARRFVEIRDAWETATKEEDA